MREQAHYFHFSAENPNHDEICRMDAVTLAAQVKAKRLSPTEVIEAVLARMERVEPLIHAFCTPTPELARADARRLAAEIAAGRSIGQLAGISVSIKDLIFTPGIRTMSGSIAYRDFVPKRTTSSSNGSRLPARS